jgi:hypothetical protein
MNFCGIQIDPAAQAAIFGFALTLASEVIGMSKLKENSLVQLVLGALKRHTPSHSEAHRKSSPESQNPVPKTTRRSSSKTSSRSSRPKA